MKSAAKFRRVEDPEELIDQIEDLIRAEGKLAVQCD